MNFEDLARYEDQTFGLFKYAKKTMTRYNERDAEELRNEVLLELLEMAERSKPEYRVARCWVLFWDPMIMYDGKTLALITITKWEYVKAHDAAGRYVHENAIIGLTCLGVAKGRGAWAGDRLAIIPLSMMDSG